MTYTGEEVATDSLRRAKLADDQLWAASTGRTHIRDERDEAVRDALRAGVPVDAVATALSIRDDDVRRMATRAIEHARDTA